MVLGGEKLKEGGKNQQEHRATVLIKSSESTDAMVSMRAED
jgi:hypothetical protein